MKTNKINFESSEIQISKMSMKQGLKVRKMKRVVKTN